MLRRIALWLLMAGFGSVVLIGWGLLYQHHWRPLMEPLSKAEREHLMFVVLLEGFSAFIGGTFGAGVYATRKLWLENDTSRLNALRAFWSALLGIPAGFLLFAFRFGEVASRRLPGLELWSMTLLSAFLLIKGAMDARLAWRLRSELAPSTASHP